VVVAVETYMKKKDRPLREFDRMHLTVFFRIRNHNQHVWHVSREEDRGRIACINLQHVA